VVKPLAQESKSFSPTPTGMLFSSAPPGSEPPTDKLLYRLYTVVGTVTAVAIGIYAAKTTTGVAGRFVESRLGKPSLIRETSRRTGAAAFNPVPAIKNMIGGSTDAMSGIVLEKELESQLRNIAVSTRNTKANSAPFRHLLMHGPPGTGKTLFAKSLAKNSTLDYAILTGGDIAPLGKFLPRSQPGLSCSRQQC